MTASQPRTHRMLFGTGLVAAAALALAATAPASGSPGDHAGKPRLAHAFVIMEENHAQDHVIGDPNMPFTNSLAASYNQATNYYGVTHTSEPNYIASTSGSNWDVNNDNGWNPTATNPATNHYDHTNIVDELEGAHISWGAYMDGMPSAGYLPDQWPATGGALYASKHNPFALYNDVRTDAARMSHVKPMNSLATDLNSGHAPRYVWISPDQCNDMHGGVYGAIAGHPETPCPYNDAPGDANDEALKTKADAFLKTTVNTIMHSKAWTPGSVIFITADETDYDGDSPSNNFYLSTAGCCDSPVLPAGDPAVSPTWPGGVYGGGLVPMIVVTKDGPRHVTDNTAYNHYSMLLTIEQGFGLTKLGFTSDSRQVKPMWSLISNH
ncbi:MAG TPA: alkaline phosphatase family protein [Flexivirga sp.]|uniref:alkaline phosphatase family protein n=1 Tax=Flexivirga sp. TaxID=1962927 RepID=UPI002CCE2133|nr:alkaline phosphatase family protein [Flexivirga sp.]HWC24282.1 alkaline phosphatase family protein [Flexivirga sp.]